MKTLLVALSMAVAGVTMTVVPVDAEARRIGGGRSAGMQRQAAPKPPATTPNNAAQNTPAQPNNPAQAGTAAAAGGAAAAAGKRSWMGPIAGLAAGLGIAALLSHLGMGEAFANMLTMILLAVVAFVAIRWLMRRFAGNQPSQSGGLQYAGAAAGRGQGPLPDAPARPAAPAFAREALSPSQPLAAAGGTAPLATGAAAPEGFDAEAFQRIAKMIFIRMQAANDAGAVDDLRKFTTPELFASLRVDLHERGGQAQQTDVLQLDAAVLDTAEEDGQWVVSVRFNGLVREASEAAAEPFDEVWHFVQPVDGSREWAIAGITQTQA